ncbi:M23 family metallopeptidase [Paenirhodobacter populi]|uniref:M23 family metallopeptidase n=1 Tax=Paenirhodobacter populi TaxID=2306993 RepID=A0A443IJH4_9RHOB|nr:M23 family metallopeptidase [Sinirhodobacter populi]RWR04714.1 M23 family metallopeptidase [Sinirhodobacter populi]
MMQRNRVIAATLVLVGMSVAAQADPLSAGQRMAERFLHGDVGAIWSASTPEMQKAFGSAGNLAALRDDLLAGFGDEDAILTERTDVQAGHDVYTRVSRWTETSAPLELVIAFDDAARIAGFFIRPQPVAAPSQFLDYETKATLRLPVDGEWFVYWGGRDIEDNYHAVDVGQRFAVDLLVMRDGQSHLGDPSRLESYHCWGRAILAPAEGVVMRAVDGLPDQAIGAADPANPAGNYVVIDFGNEEYGFLAHLRQGSVRVAKGDVVKAGQEVGLCGNSGNTSEPHLHFHMQTSPRLGRGEGLPTRFTNYQADGVTVSRGEPRRGETIQLAE